MAQPYNSTLQRNRRRTIFPQDASQNEAETRKSLWVSAATPPRSRTHQYSVPFTQRNEEVQYFQCRAPPNESRSNKTFLDRSESDLSLRTTGRSELSERLSPTASLAAAPYESFLTGICFRHYSVREHDFLDTNRSLRTPGRIYSRRAGSAIALLYCQSPKDSF